MADLDPWEETLARLQHEAEARRTLDEFRRVQQRATKRERELSEIRSLMQPGQ